jgi:ribose transport system substrate-binding protein
MMVALVKDPKTGDVPATGIKYVPHRVIKKDNVEAFHTELKERKAIGSTGAPPDDGGNKIKVGFVSNNAEEFWAIAEAGTRAAAKDIACQVLFRRPKAGTAAEQKNIIEDLLTQGVQAIAISVVDPVNQKDFLNSIADKVPLITQDNDAPDTKRRCYIGTNNYEAGKEVGKLVKETLPEGGTIAIFVGQPDPINAQERRQGVLDELAGEKDAKGK